MPLSADRAFGRQYRERRQRFSPVVFQHPESISFLTDGNFLHPILREETHDPLYCSVNTRTVKRWTKEAESTCPVSL